MNKTILLTNDDGYSAPGISALAESLRNIAQVFVVAPDRERSAIGHGLTFFAPLRMEKISEKDNLSVYSCDGTPTDCVILGIHALLKGKVDLVVSGINRGSNMGDDITYSGTVAAAMEATIQSIPALSVSLHTLGAFDYSHAAVFAADVAALMLESTFPDNIFLNINFPALKWSEIQGLKVTRQGRTTYKHKIIRRSDPRGRDYYWISGEPPECDDQEGTDFWAVKRGYVSLTPLHLSMSYEGELGSIHKMIERLDLRKYECFGDNQGFSEIPGQI